MDKHTPPGTRTRVLREIIDRIERRRERREQARDEVYLVVGFPRPELVVGRLVDLSSGGFRAIHTHMRLAAGDAVQFFQPSSSGTAVVAWTRIANGAVESGFQILDSGREAPRPGARTSLQP